MYWHHWRSQLKNTETICASVKVFCQSKSLKEHQDEVRQKAGLMATLKEKILLIETEVEQGLALQEYHEALMGEHRRMLVKISDLETRASRTWDKVQEVMIKNIRKNVHRWRCKD